MFLPCKNRRPWYYTYFDYHIIWVIKKSNNNIFPISPKAILGIDQALGIHILGAWKDPNIGDLTGNLYKKEMSKK